MTAGATNIELFPEFAWAIPKSFSVPLGECRFEQGDRLYNTVQAYKDTWKDALQHVDYSIEVLSPRRGEGAQKTDKDSATMFSANWFTPVHIAVTHHKENRTEEVRTTQGRLYTLLWRGELSTMQKPPEEVPMPLKAVSFENEVSLEIAHFESNFLSRSPRSFFITQFDETNGMLVGKAASIHAALSSQFEFDLLKERPHVVYGSAATKFAPTLYLACYVIQSVDIASIETALKKTLYTPLKNKITNRENWNLQKHGRLVLVSGETAVSDYQIRGGSRAGLGSQTGVGI